MLSTLIITILAGIGNGPPSSPTLGGWELRVQLVDTPITLVEGEGFQAVRVDISLTNRSSKARLYVPLLAAARWGDLRLKVFQPNGSLLRSYGGPFTPRDSTDAELEAGKTHAEKFSLASFGYVSPRQEGKHRVSVTLKTAEGVVTAAPVELQVVSVGPKAILASTPIPLTGFSAKRPINKREAAFVEQIQLGEQVYLFYRRLDGPADGSQVIVAARLAKLPGKVELKVEGTFGEWGPLTITYTDKKSTTGHSVLRINSVDGSLWTKEDEETLREQEKPTPPEKP
jgi:hypothetical protein